MRISRSHLLAVLSSFILLSCFWLLMVSYTLKQKNFQGKKLQFYNKKL